MLNLNEDPERGIGTCEDNRMSPFNARTSPPYSFLPLSTNHRGDTRDCLPPPSSLDLNIISTLDTASFACRHLVTALEIRAANCSSMLVHKHLEIAHEACASEPDLFCGTPYHCIRDHSIKDLPFSSAFEPVLSLHRASDPSLSLKEDVNVPESLATQLFLGPSSVSPVARSLSLEKYRENSFSLSLSSMHSFALNAANAPGEVQDIEPFWKGRVCAKGKASTRAFAYCLGELKANSRLKQLPAVLSLHEHVTFDEVKRVLQDGVIEPLAQFRPASDASAEEIQQFKDAVEKLSGHSNLLDVELSQQGDTTNAVFAAFIALNQDEGSNALVKLYLVACSNFKRLVGNLEFESLCGLKDCESESLLGIICQSPANLLSDCSTSQTTELTNPVWKSSKGPVKHAQKDDTAIEMPSKHASITNMDDDWGAFFEDRGRDLKALLENRSSSRIKHHTTRDGLSVDLHHRQLHSPQRERGRQVHNGNKSSDTSAWIDEDRRLSRKRDKDREYEQSLNDRRVRKLQGDQWVYQDKACHKGAERSREDQHEDMNAKAINKKNATALKHDSHTLSRHRHVRDRCSEIEREIGKEYTFKSKGTMEPELVLERIPNEYITKHQADSNDSKEGIWKAIIIPEQMGLSEVKRNVLYADQVGSISHEKGSSIDSLIDESIKKHAILQPTVVMEPLLEDPGDQPDLVEIDNSSCLSEKVEAEEATTEFLLEDVDKETKTWLTSKLCAAYLFEEYSVQYTVKQSDVYAQSTRNGHLEVIISMPVSNTLDAAETRWFVDQAATMVRAIASHGVFVKCVWYDGPLQLEEGISAPTISDVVKKIKGDDGKNLEKIEEATGVMIDIVVRKGGIHEIGSWPRMIGLRLKCVSRSGLPEATKQALSLLEEVSHYFSVSPELEDASLSSPLKLEEPAGEASKGNLKLSKEDDKSAAAPMEQESSRLPHRASLDEDESELLCFRSRKVHYRPLHVGNLPRGITATKIQSIIESALKDRFRLGIDLVARVRHIPDKFCAFVEFVNDDILTAALKLFEEDKAVYQGLHVSLDSAAMAGRPERQGSFCRFGVKGGISAGNGDLRRSPSISDRNKRENYEWGECAASTHESDSDFSHDPRPGESNTPTFESRSERPRPLFLSDLMDNASAQTIRQLFENVIMRYMGPSLVSTDGKQLILDVRHIPSRGCAFVDLATPRHVEFILNLYSRRPEVFMNMKMELGRKPVSWVGEEESGKRRKGSEMASHSGLSEPGRRRLRSRKRADKEKHPFGGYNMLDYVDEADIDDDVFKQNARVKKLRSDPEKTIYADRVPATATEATIQKTFEHVLIPHMVKAGMDVCDRIITEVRLVTSKYCAFVVFASEDLSRLVLNLYKQDRNVFGNLRLKPHFHTRLEDLYRYDLGSDSARELSSVDVNVESVIVRARQSELLSEAIKASAHRSVDRRRSVYVDKIPEDLSEPAMKEIFESAFRSRKHSHGSGHVVSQVVYFRDKFDPLKLCAFVEACSEDATHEIIDYFNANQDLFKGMRVRPGFKYTY